MISFEQPWRKMLVCSLVHACSRSGEQYKFGQICMSDTSSRKEGIILCGKWEYSLHGCGCNGLIKTVGQVQSCMWGKQNKGVNEWVLGLCVHNTHLGRQML